MTTFNFLKSVLINAPFWLVEFWLRPFDIVEKIQKNEYLEFWIALVSGLIWGGMLGVIFWLQTGNVHVIWGTAVAGVGGIAGAIAGTGAYRVASIVTVAGSPAFALAFVLVINEIVVRGSVGGAVGAIFMSIVGGLFASIIWGWRLDKRLFDIIFIFMALIVGTVAGMLMCAVVFVIAGLDAVVVTGEVVGAFAFAVAGAVLGGGVIAYAAEIADGNEDSDLGFFLFFATMICFAIVKTYSSSVLIFSLAIGSIARRIYQIKENGFEQNQTIFSIISRSWIFFIFFAWMVTWGEAALANTQFKQNLEMLILFLLIIPMIISHLFIYPILYIWQAYTKRNITSQWQMMPYPLPFTPIFEQFIEKNNAKNLLETAQKIQENSLQQNSVAYAIKKLINKKQFALIIYSKITQHFNPKTILQCTAINPLGTAIVYLTKFLKKEELKKQKLELFIAEYPPQKSNFIFKKLFPQREEKKHIESFDDIHQQSIAIRINYALEIIKNYLDYNHVPEFKQLLLTLQNCATVKTLEQLDNLKYQLMIENSQLQWLQQGWQLIPIFQISLKTLANYRQLNSPQSRRDLLNFAIKQLEEINENEAQWTSICSYWQNVGQEIHEIWITLLKTELKQARELLKIQLDIPEQSFQANRQLQIFYFYVHNDSNITAQALQLNITDITDPFHCTKQHDFNLPLEPHTRQKLQFSFTCHTEGDYELRGEIIATQFDGTPCREPFNTRIHVGKTGTPYRIPPHSLYVTGESLDTAGRFIGRQKLVTQLKNRWKQPDGKPAILLVGQRRIGKTSLLKHLRRIGLEECELIPLYLNAQEWQGERDFLIEFYQQLATQLAITPPPIATQDWRPCLSEFLRTSLREKLQNKRILLMIDETEELFDPKKSYGSFAGYLRSIMQSHDYPVLLLFCGAHKLKRIAKDIDSVFFNTTIEFAVSYMTEQEANEVLQKQAQNYLEYSDFALKEAYSLTHGQPLLLQMMGQQLIENFNEVIDEGKTRSNYVDYNDLQQAANQVAKMIENKAFTDHWDKSELVIQSLLAVFAATSDEVNRPQLDIESLEQSLKAHKFTLTRKQIADNLEQLTQEEILQRGEISYFFNVPLYRRWIAERHPPNRVKEKWED